MNKKLTITLTLLIFLFSIMTRVAAQPPFITEPSGNPGLLLVSAEPPEAMPKNDDYTMHIHVINNSNGKYVNNSLLCFYHMTNVSGVKTLENNLTQSTGHLNLSYYATIKGGNFTELGLYNILVQCIYEPDSVTGVARIIVHVTYSGKVMTTAQAIFYAFGLAIDLILLVGVFIVISHLPKGNRKDDNNEVIQINGLKYLTYSLYIVVYVLLWALAYILSNASFAYLEDEMLGKMFFVIQILLLRFMVPALIIFVVIVIASLVQDKKINKHLEGLFGV